MYEVRTVIILHTQGMYKELKLISYFVTFSFMKFSYIHADCLTKASWSQKKNGHLLVLALASYRYLDVFD